MPQVVIPPPPDAPVYTPRARVDMQLLLVLWRNFCEHPVNPDGGLAAPLHLSDFGTRNGLVVLPAGTDRNTVGRWFEEANEDFRVADYLHWYVHPDSVKARKRAWRALQPSLWKRALSYLYRALRKGR